MKPATKPDTYAFVYHCRMCDKTFTSIADLQGARKVGE